MARKLLAKPLVPAKNLKVRCTVKQIKIAAHMTFLSLGALEYDELHWFGEMMYQLGRMEDYASGELSLKNYRDYVVYPADMSAALGLKIWNAACLTPRD